MLSREVPNFISLHKEAISDKNISFLRNLGSTTWRMCFIFVKLILLNAT